MLPFWSSKPRDALDSGHSTLRRRANLVIVENGQWTLHYDHWCANRLDDELFWGPALATEFFRQREPVDPETGWLDEVWCEGAVVIDHDRRHLLWYGGEDIIYDVPQRRALLQLMAGQWPGWTIRWAHGGIVQVGAYLGVDSAKFAASNHPDRRAKFRVFEKDPDGNLFLLTTNRRGRRRAGRIEGITKSLELGLSGIECVLDVARHATLRWSGDPPQGGAHIDLDDRRLVYWSAQPSVLIEQRVARAWQGWETLWGKDVVELQLQHADIDVEFPLRRSTDIKLNFLEELGRRCHKPAKNPAADLVDKLGAEWTNPATNETRGAVGSADEKLATLGRLEAGLLHERERGFNEQD